LLFGAVLTHQALLEAVVSTPFGFYFVCEADDGELK
jgi:hypothetical protein